MCIRDRIGEAAAKYKLKAGEETFTISGTINKDVYKRQDPA